MPSIQIRQVPGQLYGSLDFDASSPSSEDYYSEGFRKDRNVFLLDSSFGYVDATEPVWWVGPVDSSTTTLELELNEAEGEATGLMPFEDQIALVVHTLGFSKRQLAELFGVSRQAIYDWLKGGNISGENASRLSKLAGLLQEAAPDTRRPLYHGFTTQPLADGVPSILELLRARPWNEDRILTQLRQARNLTTQRMGRRGDDRSWVSKAQGDENFTDNMLSLGEE